MGLYVERGDLVTEKGVLRGTSLRSKDGVITELGGSPRPGDQVLEAEGLLVFPGFIDLHVHGGDGADVTDDSQEAIARVCRFHAAHGTTSLLPTTRTLGLPELKEALRRLARYSEAPDPAGAAMLGIHMEGPYLNEHYKGAQRADLLRTPSLHELEELIEAAGLAPLRLVTLAPELPGAAPLVEYLAARGIIVSAGHSGASYEQMLQAADCGVRHVTHGFNGLPGLHHREPGLLGAVLLDERITVEVILDLHHVHPAAVQLLLRTKSTRGVALITDAMRAAGLPDGTYASAGGRSVEVRQGIVRLPSGVLAGSTLTMNRAVKHAVEAMGLTLPEAAEAAALTPARILGEAQRKGSIALGKDADLAIVEPSTYQVQATVVRGRIIQRGRFIHDEAPS